MQASTLLIFNIKTILNCIRYICITLFLIIQLPIYLLISALTKNKTLLYMTLRKLFKTVGFLSGTFCYKNQHYRKTYGK